MKRPTRFYSNKQEKAVAKAINGKQQSNSGATPFYKGDVISDDWLFECKTSTHLKSTFTVKREWFIKNQEEAFAMGKLYNAVVINFGDDQNYYIIEEKIFKRLKEGLYDRNS